MKYDDESHNRYFVLDDLAPPHVRVPTLRVMTASPILPQFRSAAFDRAGRRRSHRYALQTRPGSLGFRAR